MRPGIASDAGTTEVVGVVLLVGLVAAGSVGVLLAVEPTQERVNDRLRIDHAEVAFQELAATSRALTNDESRTKAIALGLEGSGVHSSLSMPENGRILAVTANGTTIVNYPTLLAHG